MEDFPNSIDAICYSVEEKLNTDNPDVRRLLELLTEASRLYDKVDNYKLYAKLGWWEFDALKD